FSHQTNLLQHNTVYMEGLQAFNHIWNVSGLAYANLVFKLIYFQNYGLGFVVLKAIFVEQSCEFFMLPYFKTKFTTKFTQFQSVPKQIIMVGLVMRNLLQPFLLIGGKLNLKICSKFESVF